MKEFKKLNRMEMKNVLGGYMAPPGDCADGCGPLNPCKSATAPYCLSTTCIDKNNVSHNITGCSPTQPGGGA